MNKIAALFLSACFAIGPAHAAEPDIIIQSDLYETSGSTNAFTLTLGAAFGCAGYIDVVSDNGSQSEAEVEVAYYDSENAEFVGTDVLCQVGPEGWIKVYCDEGVVIDYINIGGGGVTSIQFAHPEAISILSLEHNSLGSLDLAPLTNLSMLSIKDNPFDKVPLSVAGIENPYLQILDISLIDNIDPEFDIVGFPGLKSFDAMSTHGLLKLTPSACKDLQKISVDNTSISSLDVTNNPGLYILNISETRVDEVDLSCCPLLQQFYAQHESSFNADVKLKSLDVSHNPDLIYLFVTGNDFEDIDISNNPYLTDLFARKNNLTHIDLSNNSYLLNVFISRNNMDFNTLPLVQDSWLDWDFTQKDITLPRSCMVGAPIDLSAQVVLTRSDISDDQRYETSAIMYAVDPKDINNLTELPADYYTFKSGILTVNEVVADSVIAVFTNPLFEGTTLRTSQFLVKDEESFGKKEVYLSIASEMPVGSPVTFGIGLAGATAACPHTYYVDFGDGELVEMTTSTADIPSEDNVVGKRVAGGDIKVYLDESEVITALKIEDMPLSALDVTKLKEVQKLVLVNTGLYALDLSWNRCLTSLVLKGNHFGQGLTLEGASSDHSKTVLKHIVLSNNEMTDVTLLHDPFAVNYLDLSDNLLSDINLKDYDNLQYLNVCGNNLSSLVMNYCGSLTECYASDNVLTSITLPEENNLATLDITYNKFDYATLTQAWDENVEYIYAPQKSLPIPSSGPGCDMSAYLIDVDGVATSYVWKTEAGLSLQQDVDYTLEDKYAKFDDALLGQNVYCEFANALFPAFVGANALRTSAMTVDNRPGVELLSFVSSKSQTVKLFFMSAVDNNSVYIDWRGNGDLQQCFMPEAGGRYEFSGNCSTAGTVRVYSYDINNPITFFRVSDATIRNLDLSNMQYLTGLRIVNCGLTDSSVKAWPTSDLKELYIENNKFSAFDFSLFPGLNHVSFANNSLSSVDISMLPELQTATFSKNGLSSIKLDNPNLWSLDLSLNQLSEIDFSGMPMMYQLFLSDNCFASFDLDQLYALGDLRVFYVDKNALDFSTLPVPQPNWNVYVYRNQPTLEVEPIDGTVDLSSQAVRDGVDTQYIWYYGYPEYDINTGEISGEALVEGEQYVVANGVTTFLADIDKVCGVLINPLFPNAYLQTNLFSVKACSLDNICGDSPVNVDIYNLQGIKVDNPSPAPGLYIIGGKKVLIK